MLKVEKCLKQEALTSGDWDTVYSNFEGHCAVVLGAAGAIGQAICREYANCGARLWALDKDADAAYRLIESLGGNHRALYVDVADRRTIDDVAAQIWECDTADSITYSVGIDRTGNLVDLDWSDYRRVMAVNLDGAVYTAMAFGHRMLKSGRPGCFTFLSSIAGQHGEPGAVPYCISKFGMIGLVESFAAEVASEGIRVNAICPGNVDSPLLRTVANGIARREGCDRETILCRMKSAAASGRFVQPNEVANAALWLASDRASGVTGISLNVDAGVIGY